MHKASNCRVVEPHPHGWQVRSSRAMRASVVTPSKAEAVGRALEILRNLGGGTLMVHDVDGRITDSDTVAPGDDLYSPLDRTTASRGPTERRSDAVESS